MTTPINRPRVRSTQRSAVLIGAAAVVLLAGSAGTASAQYALGDGRALDANPMRGGTGFNTRGSSMATELAYRNALVTGNVGGGRQFRGSIGYTAPDDFRGFTGSDSIFRFQTDSLYSGLATQNLRGLSGLRYQFGQSTAGQTDGRLGSSNLIISRPGGGQSASDLRGTNPAHNVTIDTSGRMAGSLRSTTDFMLRNIDQPSILAVRPSRDDGTPIYRTATPLQGVRWSSERDIIFSGISNINNNLPDLSEPETGDEALTRGFGISPDAFPRQTDSETPRNTIGERIDVRQSPHERILEDLRTRAERFESERIGELIGNDPPGTRREPPAPEGEAPKATPLESLLESLRADFLNNLPEGATVGEVPEVDIRPRDTAGRDPTTFATDSESTRQRALDLIRQSAPSIDSLYTAEDAEGFFGEHMKRGQEHLAEGRWFDAEERFSNAISMRPGDSMAAVGRIHAQIGAGMFRSAAVNLRNLFLAYPELIAARYDAKLLPDTVRANIVERQLRDRIEKDAFVSREAAFLLAYLAYQSDSPDTLRDAFNALETDPDPANEPLIRFLRSVWLQ